MKNVRTSIVVIALICAPTLGQAVECSGTVELTELQNLGCDGEATKMVSLGKCDYRSDKNPSVRIFNVIDGLIGNQSVTLESATAGSFTVRITPPTRPYEENVCVVERFSWSAD